jgi:hypothetical protein
MNRRRWLRLTGACGAGVVTDRVCPAADGHQATAADGHADPKDGKFMAAAGGFGHHFCGIHVAKNNPNFQIVAQHYCLIHTDDLTGKVHQCLLFDTHEKHAKLLGIEYIVSDVLYQKLPKEERQYWHPHAYEVMGGGLIAPGMDKKGEDEFMGVIMNTWGRSVHTWPDPKTELPIGPPLLMWSLGADNQVDQKVVAERDKTYGVDTAKIKAERAKTFGFEVPQIPFPQKMDDAGRRWTTDGPDEPVKKK